MSAMEYRGQELLQKWLSGDITYTEELELFELAEHDSFLQEALEGFVGQNEINAISAEKIKAWQQPVVIAKQEAPKRVIGFVWVKYAAVILIMIGIGSILFTMTSKNEGMVADQFVVDIDEEAIKTFNEIQTVDDELLTVEEKETAIQEIMQSSQVEEQVLIANVEDVTVKEENILEEENTYIVAEVSDAVEQEMALIQNDTDVKLIEENTNINKVGLLPSGDSDSGNDLELESTYIEQDENIAEIDKSFYEFEQDNLQDNIDKKNDDPIKSFEYDIKSGVDPNEIVAGNIQSDTGTTDLAYDAEIATGNVDASGESRIEPKEVVPEIVVREYEIQKRDIINPPIQDFNSMVKERYKRKAKPEVGYYKYKKYLKQSTACLFEQYRNLDALEESVLKFRVSSDGKVQFLEFFGINNTECVSAIDQSLVEGPKWELLDFYESVDIEVPFKVLYPYLF